MKRHIKLSFFVSLVLYFIVSFIKWDIFWIKDLPNYHASTRFMIITIFLCQQVYIWLLIKDKI